MKRRANPASFAFIVQSSQPFSEARATVIVNELRVALLRLLEGTADEIHFMRLGVAVNLAAIRAEGMENNAGAVEILMAAGEALKEAERINDVHGRYGLTGPGRHALAQGVDAYEVVLRASSPRQMHLAEQELGRRLTALERQAA